MSESSLKDLEAKLRECSNFNDVFEVVKLSVERVLNMHRAGLSLVLAEIPNYIGAYHVVGSNLIVVNNTILDAVSTLAKSKTELNSFIFSVLIHEYLHSLGVLNEKRVRSLAHRVSRECFGDEHHATKLSWGDFMSAYPQLRQLGLGRAGSEFHVVNDFDRSSMPYIG